MTTLTVRELQTILSVFPFSIAMSETPVSHIQTVYNLIRYGLITMSDESQVYGPMIELSPAGIKHMKQSLSIVVATPLEVTTT